MMNNEYFVHGLRALLLVLFQGLILRQAEMVGFPWQHFFIIVYPLAIILLPIRVPTTVGLIIAFAIGLTVDLFYHSPGVHASALLVTAFIRPLVLTFLEPRGGYSTDLSPTRKKLGLTWFLQFSAILLAVHLFVYFAVEAFSFVYLGTILLNTIGSFAVSYLAVVLYLFLFNSQD